MSYLLFNQAPPNKDVLTYWGCGSVAPRILISAVDREVSGPLHAPAALPLVPPVPIG
jgi:hypothetical protein